jgi:excisionase family DNA binding protein
VAEILNCHVCTVRRYIADGRLPAHRLSARSLIILDCDLERFLADREVKATA